MSKRIQRAETKRQEFFQFQVVLHNHLNKLETKIIVENLEQESPTRTAYSLAHEYGVFQLIVDYQMLLTNARTHKLKS